jgi:VCBS repeat-containing protein
LEVQPGNYPEDVLVDKPLTLHGAGGGVGGSTITGQIGGETATVHVTALDVVIDGFRITRVGDASNWTNAGLNLAGVAIQGQTARADVRNSTFTGNRTAIDINDSDDNAIYNNVIDDNRTGLFFRNRTDNTSVTENKITNNWAIGVLFIDASGGTNSPVQSAANSTFSNNNISGNWYGQIVDRQSGGSVAAPGTNTKNFSGNWFGTTAPTRSSDDSIAEPGYAGQVPVSQGGTAVPPAVAEEDIAGPASANFDYTPFLWTGTDTAPGTAGFQGDFAQFGVTADAAQTGLTGRIQEGIDLANTGGTVHVLAGTYTEDVLVDKALTLQGAGAGTTSISGPIGGAGSTVIAGASGVVVDGFTITRVGNNLTDWNNPGLNTAGLAVQGQTTSAEVRNSVFTGNRTGIDVNNSNGNSIHNNVIDNNRTGLIFRNQTDNTTLTQNFVTNNWTVGVLFLEGGVMGVPVQSAANSSFSGNDISANWYGQIVDRQTVPTPGTTNTKNFSANWYGTQTPVVTTANSAEPGYAAQIPVVYGGTATSPGSQPDIAGPASANFDYTPLLRSGTDTSATMGFQGNVSDLTVTTLGAQTGTTGRIQEGIDRTTTGGTVRPLAGTYTEHAVVDKHVHLIGAAIPPGDEPPTIVDPTLAGNGPAIDIASSGTEADPLLVSQIRTINADGGGNTGSGLRISTGASDVTIEDTYSDGNSGHGLAVDTTGALTRLKLDGVRFQFNAGDGVRFPTSMAGLDTLTITGSSFGGNTNGMQIYGPPSAGAVTNVSINQSGFGQNTSKGIYAERLDDAVLDSVQVINSALVPNAAGIDLNLKNQAFTSIEIKNSQISGTGTGDPANGAGLMVKSRDDSGYGPTTVSGVNVHHNVITANRRGIRLGEPSQTNVGPTNVHINRNDISGNTSGEGMTNITQTPADAECNWWGAASGPGGSGPGSGDSVGSNIDFKPWLRTNVLTGNCPPEAVDDSASTNEDTSVNIAVLANDKDVENSSLTPTNVSDPPNGSVTVNPNGTITYTPDANYFGTTDSFTYTADDGTDESEPATVSLTVNSVNDVPVANTDTESTDEDTPLNKNVLTNDTDVANEGQTLSAVKVTNPAHGSVTLDANGSYTYTPSLNYNGSDSFTYKANDGQADSNVATVNITVNAVNDAPVAGNDGPLTVHMNGTIDSNMANPSPADDPVLANDTDVDNTNASLTAVLVDDVDDGTLTLHEEDGSYSYEPDPNFSGSDSFQYKARDPSNADSNVVTVSITVTASNQSPTAMDDAASTSEDTPLTDAAPGVLENDTDPEFDPLTAAKASDPANGTVTLNSNGSYTYTPDKNFSGSDSFTYTASDAEDTSNEATVAITVNAVQDAPAAADDDRAVNEDAAATNLNVRSNDADADGDPFTVTSASDPANGSTALSGGDVTYTPDANYCNSQAGGSPDTFTYTVSGGDTAAVSVAVLCADDAPVGANDAQTVAQGAPATAIDVLANDPDPDGGPKQVAAATQAANGTTVASATGVTYRPDPLYCNSQPGGTPDTFTYTLNGGSQATVSMTVTCRSPGGEDESTAPVFASARVTNTTFAVNTRGPAETPATARAKQGTTFLYNLSEPARVVFTIEQRTTGRRVGSKCVRPTKSNARRRACTRYVKIGSFAQDGAAGANRKAFSGKIGRKTLRPGSYRATLVATDTAGNKSNAKRINLRVVRR